MEGTPKLHHFVWRACAGSLTTKGKDRHIIEDMRCDHCNGKEESIVHDI